MRRFDAMASSLDRPLRRTLIRGAIAAPLIAAGGRFAFADGTRPIRIVVPFPAGGSSDTLTRVAAAALTQHLKRNVIVENKGGAGGNIAADYVARGPKDGSLLLLAGQAILDINQPLYGNLSYDPAAFRYAGMLGENANVLLVNPKALPVNTVDELIAQARARPGAISFGSNGVGSLAHLTTEVLANAAHVRFLHVPYQGAAPLANDLRAGRVDFCFTGSTLAVTIAAGGAVRPLAVTTPVRLPQMPNVPTMVESGYPALDAPSWWAVMAPPGTPDDVMAMLQHAFAAITATPRYIAALNQQATLPFALTPAASVAFFAREREKWATAVKTSGAKHTGEGD
jgi:tripartite-type tricarboxylate transporter receptor subunit TctC